MTHATDPFTLLDLPRRFDLRPDEINLAHLRAVRGAHPDLAPEPKGIPGSTHDLELVAAHINDAKRALEDPERRANALLSLLGGPTKEADRSLPEGFLIEMMAMREEIEEAAASKNAEIIAARTRWAGEQRAGYIVTLSSMFGALSQAPSPPELRAIRTTLNAWRYIERLIEQLDPDYEGLSA